MKRWSVCFGGVVIVLLAGCCTALAKPLAESMDATVGIKELPEYHLAYVECKGDFQGNDEIYDVLLGKLLAWAIPKKLWDYPGTTKMILIYPDDSRSTPKEEQRLWLGITVPEGTSTPDGIRTLTIPEAAYAVGSFEISAREFGRAWGYMMGEWMPASGYRPAGGYSFEMKKNDSDKHPEKKHIVDICIPVEKK